MNTPRFLICSHPQVLPSCLAKTRRIALAALILFGLAKVGSAQTNILFVGNSFTHGNENPVLTYNHAAITDANNSGQGGVPGIFKKLTVQAGLSYNVTIEADSGQDLVYHYVNKSAIIGQPQWSVVVLQEYSTTPLPASHGGNPTEFHTGAQELQTVIRNAAPTASIYLYETWAYPAVMASNGYTSGGSTASQATPSDLQAMQNDLQAAYFQAFYTYAFTGVARVGDGFLQAIGEGMAVVDPADAIPAGEFSLWLADDRKHPSIYGAYLSAAILFAKITHANPTLLSYAGSPAADLGISATDFARLNEVAYEINALPDPSQTVTPPPTTTLNTLKAGTNLNWNAAANWDHALATTDAVLINSNAAAISQVANSLDGSGHAASIQTLSFDLGANSKTVQPNLTTQNPRTLTLTGGTDALGGSDLIHLSSTTTGVANLGANTGFSTLTTILAADGKFEVGNAAGILDFGPSSIISGTFNLVKTGPGTLVLTGVNTFGGAGKTFTVAAGNVLANTPASGTNSATGMGSVLVDSGATLGGIGQVTPGTGNQVSVLAGGVVAPGAGGVGTLTVNGSNTALNVLAMASGAKFLYELNSSGAGNFQSDRVALINGGATGGIAFLNNVIDFSDLSGGNLPVGVYTPFTATSAGNYGGITMDANGIITAGLSIGAGLSHYGPSTLQVVGNNLVLNLAAATSSVSTITSVLTRSGTVGAALSYQITATNGPTGYTASPLPPGLSLNPTTGVISGTPTAAGTTNTLLAATNALGTGPGATLVFTIGSATGAPNLAPGKTAAASSFQAGNLVANANDGSGTTRWAASDATYPQWWKVDLGASHTLSRADITWYNSASRAYKYKVETSPDDVTYALMADKTTNTVFGNTSDVFAATARYVRITVTGCTAGAGQASAYEFQIFGL